MYLKASVAGKGIGLSSTVPHLCQQIAAASKLRSRRSGWGRAAQSEAVLQWTGLTAL